MKKKKESDDILKQFYANLLLLTPESFFFNQDITELMLQYLQNFVKSKDRCDFGFQIKNENSIETNMNSHETIKQLNSILVPTLSLSSLNEGGNSNGLAFDSYSKYNHNVKIFIKQNPIFSCFKKDLISQLYYQSSQRLTFLAICHMIRPSMLKKIIFDRKREKANRSRWKSRNIFQENLENDDPPSFINSIIKDEGNKNDFSDNNISSYRDSILVEEFKPNEIQPNSILIPNKTENSYSKDEVILSKSSNTNENNENHNDDLIPKEEEKQFASDVDFALNENDIKAETQNVDKIISKDFIANEKEENNQMSNNESVIEDKEAQNNADNQNKSDNSFTKDNKESNIETNNGAVISQVEKKQPETKETKSEIYTEADITKSENEISITKDDRSQPLSNISPNENEGQNNGSALTKSEIFKTASELNFSTNKKDEILIENSFLRNEDSMMKAEREEISESDTQTELFDDSYDDFDFDLDSSFSQVFDELSLSFFEMRTGVLGRITRGTEPLFERWSQIACSIFFEFVSSDSHFASLRKNSPFSAKFEDFARSLVLGFVSSEKQSYHTNVISLLPPESRFFYVKSFPTLDSIDRNSTEKVEIEKEKKNDFSEDESEFSTKLIEGRYMYYHHRQGIETNSIKPSYSTVNDSTFLNTTSFGNETQKSSYLTVNLSSNQNGEVNENTQKVLTNENDHLNEFSVSKFMNPVLASFSTIENESIESFSMKLVLAKAVHEKAIKESQALLNVGEASPLINRALELRGVTPPHRPPDPSQYSPRRMRNAKMCQKKDESNECKVGDQLFKPKSITFSNDETSSQKSPRKSPTKSRIKVTTVNQKDSKEKNSNQSNSSMISKNDTFYTYNRRMKTLKKENKMKNKNDEKRFQIQFDLDPNEGKNLKAKKNTLKSTIKRAKLAESRGFIVREKAIEQHNRGVLNDYEIHKRSIYRDICSNEAKCAEELEKCASNGNLIVHSNLGKSVLFDKLEKNIRQRQVNQSFERLNGRAKGFGMEYATDYSQLEGSIATAILEDDLF